MLPRLAPYAWTDRAACRSTNPDYWDLDTNPQVTRFQRDMCLTCPVLAQCAISAKSDKATGVVRAATACRRGSQDERIETEEALERVALAALLADGRPIRELVPARTGPEL